MNPPGAPPAFLGGPGNPNGNPNGAFGLPMAMGQAPAQMPPQQQMQAGAAGQPLDEFRQGFLELLEEQALTDIEMTVGPQNEEIGAHR